MWNCRASVPQLLGLVLLSIPLLSTSQGSEIPVPCSLRSWPASGVRVSDFAIFKTLNTSVSSDLCDLSHSALTLALQEEGNFSRLDSKLPDDFFTNDNSMHQDCSLVMEYGMRVLGLLRDYATDCFFIRSPVTPSTPATCFLRRALGPEWSEKLLPQPLSSSAPQTLNCSLHEPLKGPEAYRCTFGNQGAGSIVRLSVCSAHSWLAGAEESIAKLLSLCASRDSCGQLCFGRGSNSTARGVKELGRVLEILAPQGGAVRGTGDKDFEGHEAANRGVDGLRAEGVGAKFRTAEHRGAGVPGAGGRRRRTEGRRAESREAEDFQTSGSWIQAPQYWSLGDKISLMESKVWPMTEVVMECWGDSKCADESSDGRINVSTGVCSLAAPGLCPEFDSTIQSVRDALGVFLREGYTTSKPYCLEWHGACGAARAAFDSHCLAISNKDRCRRASDPLGNAPVWRNCDEENLHAFYLVAQKVNEECVASTGSAPIRLTGGRDEEAELEMCFISDLTLLWLYVAAGTTLGFCLVFALVFFRFVSRRRMTWMTASDAVLDISISRDFAVAVCTWLLFTFYDICNKIFLNPNGHIYQEVILKRRFPLSVYLLLLAILWLPWFGIVLVGNNPWRGVRAKVVSSFGLLLAHPVTIYLSYRGWREAYYGEQDAGVMAPRIAQMIIHLLLLFATDILFWRMLRQHKTEGHFYQIYKDSCHRVSKMLLGKAKTLDFMPASVSDVGPGIPLTTRYPNVATKVHLALTVRSDYDLTRTSLGVMICQMMKVGLQNCIVLDYEELAFPRSVLTPKIATTLISKAISSPATHTVNLIDVAAGKSVGVNVSDNLKTISAHILLIGTSRVASQLSILRQILHEEAGQPDVGAELKKILKKTIKSTDFSSGISKHTLYELLVEGLASKIFQQKLLRADVKPPSESIMKRLSVFQSNLDAIFSYLYAKSRKHQAEMTDTSISARRTEVVEQLSILGGDTPEELRWIRIWCICSPLEDVESTLRRLLNLGRGSNVRLEIHHQLAELISSGREELLEKIREPGFVSWFKNLDTDEYQTADGSKRNPYPFESEAFCSFEWHFIEHSTEHSVGSLDTLLEVVGAINDQQTKLSNSVVDEPMLLCLVQELKVHGWSSNPAGTMLRLRQMQQATREKGSHRLPSATQVPTIIFVGLTMSVIVVLLSFIQDTAGIETFKRWLVEVITGIKLVQDSAMLVADFGLYVMPCFRADLISQVLNERVIAEVFSLTQAMQRFGNGEAEESRTRLAGAAAEIQDIDAQGLKSDIRNLRILIEEFQQLQTHATSQPPNIEGIMKSAKDINHTMSNMQIDQTLNRLDRTAEVIEAVQPVLDEEVDNLVQLGEDTQEKIIQYEHLIGPVSSMYECTVDAINSYGNHTELNVSEMLVSDLLVQPGEISDNSSVFDSLLESLGSESENASLARDCRTFIRRNRCMEEVQAIFPQRTIERLELRIYFDDLISPPFAIQARSSKAISAQCISYLEIGCKAVSTDFTNPQVQVWISAIRKRLEELENRANHLDTYTSAVMSYAERNLVPCLAIGKTIGFGIAMMLNHRIVLKFREAIQTLRAGKAPQTMSVMNRGGIGCTASPKLVGIVMAVVYISYFCISWFLAIIFMLFTNSTTFQVVLDTAGSSLFLEIVASLVILGFVLDLWLGRTVVFNWVNELQHPVAWTWLSSFLMIVNLARGVAHAILRVIYQIVLLFFQFAIIDRTMFPRGLEWADPAYTAFMSCVYFHHKYRNPTVVALAGEPDFEADHHSLREFGLEDFQDGMELHSVSRQPTVARKFRSMVLMARTLSNNPSVIPLRVPSKCRDITYKDSSGVAGRGGGEAPRTDMTMMGRETSGFSSVTRSETSQLSSIGVGSFPRTRSGPSSGHVANNDGTINLPSVQGGCNSSGNPSRDEPNLLVTFTRSLSAREGLTHRRLL